MQRLGRRREQLGPVNPLAQEEYAEALAHVEELETRRADLETALRELRTLIRDTDRQISETFEQTFAAAARNFEELVGDVFPGGSGRLRLVRDEQHSACRARRAVAVAGAPPRVTGTRDAAAEAARRPRPTRRPSCRSAPMRGEGGGGRDGRRDRDHARGQVDQAPVAALGRGEVDDRARVPVRRVSRAPCPFYILDEVEAALDDLNLDRFLALLRRYSDRAQFIVITHQKRTMEAADWLYGVSMGGDGVSKVLSRRLPPRGGGAGRRGRRYGR